MYKPKTVRGFLSLCKRVADIAQADLDDLDKYPETVQDQIGLVMAGIDNQLGEIEDIMEDESND